LRWQNPELPADHARLELYGSALSTTTADFEWRMEVPGATASELMAADVRFWHKADIRIALIYVCFWG
jgi:hypothetical protein